MPHTLATARHETQVVVFQDTLLVIGSRSSSAALASVEQFDGTAWTPHSTLGDARSRFAATVFHNSIYVDGGDGNSGMLTSLEVYNGQWWASAGNLQQARRAMATCVFNDVIYIIGGESSLPTVDVETFDSSQLASAPSLDNARSYLGCVAAHGQLLAVGRYSESGRLASVEAIGIGDTTWVSAGQMDHPSREFAIVA